MNEHIHNVTANRDSLYYVQTDLCGGRAQSQTCLGYAETEQSVRSNILGSWDRVVDSRKNIVQSSHFDPWGNRMSASDWTSNQDGSTFQFHRGFTGHEHYDRFGVINMNARLYDPVLGRFFSPDPQVQSPFSTQGYNRYSYCGNNPVMYVDEDGELFWLIPVIAGVIGGSINLGIHISNGNLSGYDFWSTVGRGAAAFLGGAVAGGVNSWLSGGNIVAGAVGGCLSSLAGNMAGQWAVSNTGNMLINGFNITSPVAKGIVAGGIGGASAGYSSGFVWSLIANNGDFSMAHHDGLRGVLSGTIMGSISGGVSAYCYARNNNINPWKGTRNNGVMIGEGMNRIKLLSKDMKVSSINDDWPDGLDAYDYKVFKKINSESMDFNSRWIEFQMKQEMIIYDIGPIDGGAVTSPFYNMEVGRTMDYTNIHYVHVVILKKILRVVTY